MAIETGLKKTRAGRRRLNERFGTLPDGLRMLLWGFILTVLIEAMCRHSLAASFVFLWQHPLPFVYSWLVLSAWVSLSLLFRRRSFAFFALALVWLLLGGANGIILLMRVTPLSAVDFTLLMSVSEIITVYVSPIGIAGIIGGAVALTLLLAAAWRRSTRLEVHWVHALLTILLYAGVTVGVTFLFLRTGALASTFANLSEDYKENGFVYCFGRSLFDRGIDKPSDYSPQTVDEVLEEIQKPETGTPRKDVNIVFVQLESFFDVNNLKGVTYSQNPVPTFSALETVCSNGHLTVPVVGAGTANTEFEILTGMSLDYFGTGEYPYKTILQSSTCESVCYDLAAYGYTSHAIHNNTATFYDRNRVFSNLGFDTFTSIEYMQGVERNRIGWAKDEVLTKQIMDALQSTSGPDFVYTITVQSHGKYPNDSPAEPYTITASGLRDAGQTNSFEYYLSQLHDTDAFLSELVRELSLSNEPVVLVAYGDHLPNFGFEAEDLVNGDIFQTEYILWSNIGLEKEDRDLSAYQLMAMVQQRLGMSSGVLTRLHQDYSDNPNYQSALETLEYDMLYGDKLVYGETTPYEHTDVQMGVLPVTVSGIVRGKSVTIVNGANFTPYSVVYVDGKPIDTLWRSGSRLSVSTDDVNSGTELTVCQCSGHQVLSGSNVYAIPTPLPEASELLTASDGVGALLALGRSAVASPSATTIPGDLAGDAG